MQGRMFRRLLGALLVIGLAVGVQAPARAATWSAWQLTDPTTGTQHPVATTVFGGRLYLFEVDSWDSRIWYKTMADGTSWSGWSQAGAPPPYGTVPSADATGNWIRFTPLAVSVYNNQLHLFAVGANFRVYDETTSNG